MVLFVKAWAKRRKINSSYSGTLSSYGYVLMVLHYLVNVAQPPVCPNLQLCWRPEHAHPDPPTALALTLINGYEVRFWRDENAIRADATQGRLTANRQPLGALLRGFFQYYASPGYGIRSFNWMGEVLSLRTPGGICTKQMKGWTGAKSTLMDGREVRHRYLFAIEDPFEWDHNVARTVTHYGIVAIRDEFRRAWRIIAAVGGGRVPEGELFEAVVEATPPVTPAPSQPASVVTITAEEDRENMKPVSDLGGW
jgi:terminal uridylyltransferase